jgi:DNA-binding HxlR family transcriptional regulator
MALIIGLLSSTIGGRASYVDEAHSKEQKLPGSKREMANEKALTIGHGLAGCPLDPILSFLALKWLVHIVWFLGLNQSLRFTELQRQLPGRVSAKVLSGRLKQLERLAMVEREDKGAKPPHVEYRLTSFGRAFNELLTGIELQTRQIPLPKVPLPSSLRHS